MIAGGVRVREATPADASGIARVQVDTWRSAYRGMVPDAHLDGMSYEDRARRWQTIHGDPGAGHGTFVAQTPDGEIVGFASGGPERTGDPVHQGELYAIYVLGAHQRRGLGRGLTGAVVERLIDARLWSMKVWVLERNPCRAFYERIGGQAAGELDLEIGGVVLRAVAYGWGDLGQLLRACSPDSGRGDAGG